MSWHGWTKDSANVPETPSFDVVWSSAAVGDLDGVISFIEMESADRALHVWTTLKRRIETLSRFPLRGRLVPELKAIGLDLYRELIVYPYRVLFRIQGRKVLVLGVFDGRRDLEEMLFERLTRDPSL